ncbi:MAG: ATPase, T2SS/T4P/T4SS family [Thermodesulfobacteriota bacterium]
MAVKRIGELLIEAGLINEEQLNQGLAAAKEKKMKVGAALVELGFASEMDIAQTLGYQLNIPFADFSSLDVDPTASERVKLELAQKNVLFPVEVTPQGMTVAMSDPLNLAAIDDIRFATGLQVIPLVATTSDVNAAIKKYYLKEEPVAEAAGAPGVAAAPAEEVEELVPGKKDRLVELVREKEDVDIEEVTKKSSAPPIVSLVETLFIAGVDQIASDIHLEPQEKAVKVRFRIDGVIKSAKQLPKWVQGPVTARLKSMAKLDVGETRVPQEGRMKLRVGDKVLEVRVRTLPGRYGEMVGLGLLEPQSTIPELKSLGLNQADEQRLMDTIKARQGVVLVTGPVGAGGTTLLYAMLEQVKNDSIKVVTLEDPPKYEVKDINQMAISDTTGLSFSEGLHFVLKHDVDVILVAEMRDSATAMEAFMAAIAGRLIFSALHTVDAASAITQLKSIGVPVHLIASALKGIVAQRLVRRLCAKCREQYAPDAEELRSVGITKPIQAKLYRAKGCDECKGTGYMGKTGIFEVLTVDATMESLIDSDASEQQIRKAAAAAGMKGLLDDGLRKVGQGITSIDEVARVVHPPKELTQAPPPPPAPQASPAPAAPPKVAPPQAAPPKA